MGTGDRDITTMEIINKELVRSKLYLGLKEKYLMRKAQPFALVVFAVWIMWLSQLVVATASVPVVVNILH